MNIKRQQGITTLGIMIGAVFIIAVMLLAIKVVPLYMNDYAIGKAVASLAEEENLYRKTKSEIRSIVRRKLTADYVDDLEDDAFQVEKRKGTIVIDINYEARVSVVSNIDLVAKFSHHLEKAK